MPSAGTRILSIGTASNQRCCSWGLRLKKSSSYEQRKKGRNIEGEEAKWFNRNRNLEISTTPTKAKSREPAYSQALFQNKIDKQRVKIRRVRLQGGRQTAMMDGV